LFPCSPRQRAEKVLDYQRLPGNKMGNTAGTSCSPLCAHPVRPRPSPVITTSAGPSSLRRLRLQSGPACNCPANHLHSTSIATADRRSRSSLHEGVECRTRLHSTSESSTTTADCRPFILDKGQGVECRNRSGAGSSRLPQNGTIATLDGMTRPAPIPDMQTLMAAVGEVLLTWGYVESAILDRLAVLEGASSKYPKTSPISRWRNAETPTPEIAALLAEIERLADVRHCVAHGLETASVNPEDAHAPAVTCRTPVGRRRLSYETLVEAQRALHRLSHEIRALPPKGP